MRPSPFWLMVLPARFGMAATVVVVAVVVGAKNHGARSFIATLKPPHILVISGTEMSNFTRPTIDTPKHLLDKDMTVIGFDTALSFTHCGARAGIKDRCRNVLSPVNSMHHPSTINDLITYILALSIEMLSRKPTQHGPKQGTIDHGC